MMARSFFNDTFTLYKTDSNGVRQGNPLVVDSEGIAWPDDKKYKYKNLPSKEKYKRQWLNVEDERFIVWMRAAATPTFRKLWGKIKGLPLKSGKYEVEIVNSKNF